MDQVFQKEFLLKLPLARMYLVRWILRSQVSDLSPKDLLQRSIVSMAKRYPTSTNKISRRWSGETP
jgi:hypothetical protein